MNDNSTGEVGGYLRAAVVTSEHPGKPLEGTVVAFSTSHDISIEDPFFGEVIEQANSRFNVDSYAEKLRLGTVYFDASTRDIVGVSWEDLPFPYDHGDFAEPVNRLPEDLIPANDLV